MSTSTLTRRAALIGVLTSSAALAVPATVALGPRPDLSVSAELVALLDAYEAGEIGLKEAEEAQHAMEDEFRKRLAAANIQVRLTGRSGLPHYRKLDHHTWPGTVRSEIEYIFSRRLAAAVLREVDEDPYRRVLPTPENVRAERREVELAARPQFARFHRIKRSVDWEAAHARVSDAYEAQTSARKALFAYRPRSLQEVQAIAAAMYRAAAATGRWYAMPTKDFLTMVAGVEVQS